MNDIRLNDKNPRTINKRQMDRLVKSVQEFPEMTELRPIVVDENNTILGGNMALVGIPLSVIATSVCVQLTMKLGTPALYSLICKMLNVFTRKEG